MKTRGVSRWSKMFLLTELSKSIHTLQQLHSKCLCSGLAAHLIMHIQSQGHIHQQIQTRPFFQGCLKRNRRRSPSHLSMSIPPKHSKLFPLLKKNSTFPMAKWCILLVVNRTCTLPRLPMTPNSFESFCIKTLLKITEEVLVCIPCLHYWYYFSDSYLPR